MMSMKALPIGEARKRLPELVRQVAQGRRTVAIGRGGRPEVMLVPVGAAALAVTRRPLRGLVEIVGSERDLVRGQHRLRRIVDASLERTARFIAGRVRKRPL
jgi:antitoxin (DNA-binding transcriptional repressor) of toxin-antitoxin stability system